MSNGSLCIQNGCLGVNLVWLYTVSMKNNSLGHSIANIMSAHNEIFQSFSLRDKNHSKLDIIIYPMGPYASKVDAQECTWSGYTLLA